MKKIKIIPHSLCKLTTLLILTVFFENCTQQRKPAIVEKSNPQYYTIADFKTVEKYDAHVHVNTGKETLLKQAEEYNFRLVTINWDDVNDRRQWRNNKSLHYNK